VIWSERLAIHAVCEHNASIWVEYPIELDRRAIVAIRLENVLVVFLGKELLHQISGQLDGRNLPTYLRPPCIRIEPFEWVELSV
jgi:hypothetical protein